MYYNYFIYLTSLQKKETLILLVDLFSFLFVAYAFIDQWVSDFEFSHISFSIIMIFILSGIKLVYDTYKIVTDILKYKKTGKYEKKAKDKIIINDQLLELKELMPSESEERDGYKKVHVVQQNDFVFYSSEVDRCLWKNDFLFEEDKLKARRIKTSIRENKDILIPFLNQQFYYSLFEDKHFYNENKLCLSDDIDIKSKSIFVHKGSYFDTYLTNHVCTNQLLSKDSHKVMFDGTNFFPAEYYKELNEIRLLEIKFSTMNNEIGISTIGITKDHYLIIWKQNSHAQSSNDLFVPTGSGSSDWKDIIDQDFIKTIANGMQRELWEESGKKDLGTSHHSIGKTKVLGFFRWAKRGGKPEFVGITKLNARSLQLEAMIEEVRKPKEKHMWKIDTLEQLKQAINEIMSYKEISIPLFMCMYSLEQYMRESPEELKEMLGIN